MFKRRFYASLILTLLLLFGFGAINSYANDTSADNSIKVLLEGKYIQFKESPVEIDGRILVPMRDIFESLQATVSWDDSTSTVTGIKGNTKIVLQLDNPTAYVNDSPISLSVPGTLVNDKTMVPTRFIAESMNCVVSWDEGTKTVIIVPDKTITFKDKNLENAIKGELSSDNTDLKVSDVESIVKLNISDKDINNLDGLQNLINLENLTLSKNNISNISDLSGLLKLKYLDISSILLFDISNNSIDDISSLKNLLNLVNFRADNNKLDSIGALANHNNLKNLSVSKNKLSDISVVEQIPNLQLLNANYTLVDNISPVASLKDLKTLFIANSQITDISPLKECTNLNELNIYGDAILDVSPLKTLNNLHTLYYDKYPSKTEINSELFDRSSALTTKANKIISEIIKPGMSDLDKELAIHDYIVLNTTYDKSDTGATKEYSHNLYGVLINGVGVCDGYSSAMKALLSLVNIKSINVIGDSIDVSNDNIGHAWNLVKIDGKYYYVDATWDDSGVVDGVNTLSHTFFNLSKKQISVNHKFDRDFYPDANIDNADFDMWNNNNHYFVINDDYTFSCLSGYILKIDNKTQTATKLSDNKVREISYNDGWIYYINHSEGDKLYKIKTDGSENTLLYNEPVLHQYIINKSAYFVDISNRGILNGSASSNYVHKLDLNTKSDTRLSNDDMTTSLYIIDNTLFYKSFSINKGATLKRSDLDGKLINVIGTSMAGFIQTNNSIKFDNKLLETIKDNWIYYINDNQSGKLFKISIDSKDDTALNTGSVYNNYYHIIGDWIYYVNADDNNKIYRVKTDGTQNSLVDKAS